MQHPRDSIKLGTARTLITDDIRSLSNLRRRVYLNENLLPEWVNYWRDTDPVGPPAAPSGSSGSVAFKNVILAWNLPDIDLTLFRTYEVYEGTTVGFAPDTTNFSNRKFVTSSTVVSIPHDVGPTTYYFKVCAVNTRGERSPFISFGPYVYQAVPGTEIADAAITNAKIANAAVDTAKIADAAITSVKIGDAQITDAKIASLSANKIRTGTLEAIDIRSVRIYGSIMEGSTFKTAGGTAARLEIGELANGGYIRFYNSTVTDLPGEFSADTIYGTSRLFIKTQQGVGELQTEIEVGAARKSSVPGNPTALRGSIFRFSGYDYLGVTARDIYFHYVPLGCELSLSSGYFTVLRGLSIGDYSGAGTMDGGDTLELYFVASTGQFRVRRRNINGSNQSVLIATVP